MEEEKREEEVRQSLTLMHLPTHMHTHSHTCSHIPQEGELWVVMQLFDAGSLDDVLKFKISLTELQIAAILYQVCMRRWKGGVREWKYFYYV